MTVGIIGPGYVAIADADVAAIVTAYPGMDYRCLAATVPTVDLRGVTRNVAPVTVANSNGITKELV